MNEEAKIDDVRAMDVIPYESGSFYVFDRLSSSI